jgi:hypothetical protein
VGFAAETEDLIAMPEKTGGKSLDLVIANNISAAGSGMAAAPPNKNLSIHWRNERAR